MGLKNRFSYWSRILQNYSQNNNSQLSFWHENSELNGSFSKDSLGEYYMTFGGKARYKGPFDKNGVPLLDYGAAIGKQYNPIAICQYGLAHYNIFKKTGCQKSFFIFIIQANWLVDNLEKNEFGINVWMHHFEWDYFKKLHNPWYSGLAQGQAISLLVRAYHETEEKKYSDAAVCAFDSFLRDVKNGGVKYIDKKNNVWIEEYITDPPTHILNGFIWALWGIYDYYLLFKDESASSFYKACLKTIKENIYKYDIGFWSLYDLSLTKIRPIASHFYHKLHITQLKVLYILSGDKIFDDYSKKWQKYQDNLFFRFISFAYKIFFKICHY